MLSDVVVLDLTTVVSGATTTAILADRAHVIKVRTRDGDPCVRGADHGWVSLW
jgi:crotonobetainyl-CoA:carnitine CoA-transferase CaiB-like acyl-CoA transferase